MRTFKDIQKEFLKTPEDAKAYLDYALEQFEKDRDHESFLLALHEVAEAQGHG